MEGEKMETKRLDQCIWPGVLPLAIFLLLQWGSTLQAQKSPPTLIQMQKYEFEVVTVNLDGVEIKREHTKTSGFSELLGDGVQLEMITIPSGSFIMGSPETEAGREECEGPQHQVFVRRFYMGRTEVSRRQWNQVCKLPKIHRHLEPRNGLENFPMDCISWYEAVEFCDRLTRKTGRKYRLPTESEWEYACRAKTTTPYHFGATIIPQLACYADYYKSFTNGAWESLVPVGTINIPNGFGLLDMHGSVAEWCLDKKHMNYKLDFGHF